MLNYFILQHIFVFFEYSYYVRRAINVVTSYTFLYVNFVKYKYNGKTFKIALYIDFYKSSMN